MSVVFYNHISEELLKFNNEENLLEGKKLEIA